MKVPQQFSWTAGDEPDADAFNLYIRDSLNFLLDPPEVYLVSTVSQTLTAAAWTVIRFQSVETNNDNMALLTNGSTDRFTVKTPGWYEMRYGTSYSSSSDASINRLTSGLQLNGSADQVGRRDSTQIATTTIFQGGRLYSLYLNVNDFIQLASFHDGTNRSTVVAGGTDVRPYLHAKWVSK